VEGGRQPGGDAVDDLDTALALADLLAEGTMPGPRPPRPPQAADQLTRLRAAVRQLEHALASRVVVEQAIGVLTERWRIAPRQAFEQLRRVTRSRGLRIHELARSVVDSATDPDVWLPGELVPPVPQAGGPPPPRRSTDRADSDRPAAVPGAAQPSERPREPAAGHTGQRQGGDARERRDRRTPPAAPPAGRAVPPRAAPAVPPPAAPAVPPRAAPPPGAAMAVLGAAAPGRQARVEG
jgi:hypothetical protein